MSNNLNEVVANMQKQDVYSILCSFLYDLKDVPEYAVVGGVPAKLIKFRQ